MPIYEYSCRKCGRDFEELVFDDTPPTCPHCGSNDTHKLMEEYDREMIKVQTSGQAVGQVNGLSVTWHGDFEFGLPHRISWLFWKEWRQAQLDKADVAAQTQQWQEHNAALDAFIQRLRALLAKQPWPSTTLRRR
jgi:putative regulatory protein, FmdB family